MFTYCKACPIYESSTNVERHFCAKCGTGLFYFNEAMLPGLVDIRSVTFDHPDVFAPAVHVQVAERIGWTKTAHELPEFERFPPHA